MIQHPFLTREHIPQSLPLAALYHTPACPRRSERVRRKTILSLSDKENKNNSSDSPLSTNEPKCVFIMSYLDYSDRYGLFYTLSNGDMGALFNDGTSLLSGLLQRQETSASSPNLSVLESPLLLTVMDL